jgi:hypothetical protein
MDLKEIGWGGSVIWFDVLLVINKSKSNTTRLGIVILFDYMFRPFLIRPKRFISLLGLLVD